MNENNLMQQIDAVLAEHPQDTELIRQSAEALQRRLNTTFNDLGLGDMAPTVRVVSDAGYEVIVEFPVLNRRMTDRMLRRLEDVERMVNA